MARIRYVLNPLTGFFDAVEITPPDYIQAVADTATIDLTVTAGTLTADVNPDSITNALLAEMPANTIKGNNTGVTANPIDLTATQVTALLSNFTGDTYSYPGGGGIKGLVPAPDALHNAKQFFLRASGSFESPHVRATPEEAVRSTTYSVQSMPAANQWFGACWSPEQGQYVAVSSNGTNRVATSPDGVTWTSRSAAAARVWTKVAWSPELRLYAAVAFDGTTADNIMTSPDGITWTSRTSPQANQWYDIVWAPALGLFVACSINGTNRIMTSPDGIVWTAQTIPSAQWYSVTWSEELNLLCAVSITASGGNYAATSPDGITWTSQALTTGNTWYSVCWAAELGLFVAVGVTGTSRCATSPDGITWTLRSIAANSWRRVEYSPELRLLVAVASGGQISTSPDGVTWTARTSPQANQWYEVVWSPERGQFIILGITGTNRCLTSRYIGIRESPKAIQNIADTASLDLSLSNTGILTGTVLSAPGTTGTPLTLARYDSLGNLVSSNYWFSYDDGQISGGSTLFTDNGSALNIATDVQLATTINNLNLYAGTLTNNGTLTGYNSLLNLSFVNNGTNDFINGTNIGLTGNTVNDKQYASYYSSGTVGGNFSGISFNLDDVVSGNTTFFSVNRTNTSTLSTTGINLYFSAVATMSSSFTGFSVGIDADVNDYGTLINLNTQGDILKGFSVVNANFSGDIGDGTGVSLIGLNLTTQNTTTIDGGIFGVSISNAATIVGNNTAYGLYFNNQGPGYRHVGATSLNNADQSEEIRGFEHNTVGDSRTSTGLDITMSGNATDDAQGIRVNVGNQTSTNTRVRSMDINGHTWSYNNLYRPSSGLFVDTANNNFTEYRIASGSPVTGTDVLANNHIVAYLIEDDQALGPVGLGAATMNAISLIGIADTKTIDLIRGMLVVASVQDPGYADSGTVDRFEGIVYAGALAGGGSSVINTALGLYMPTGFDGYAGTNWGILVDGTTADNYVNKLAIGTAGFTAASGLLLDVNGQVGITDIGSGLSIAEGANAKMGTSTLVAGTVTVATTAVTANSRIFITNQAAGGTVGSLYIANIVTGTSFDIVSTDAGDTSTVAWQIVEAI